MRYTLKNGKVVTIPDKEISNNMELLELSKEDAIQLWLEDNGHELNIEQDELDAKAKSVKIKHGASSGNRKKSEKPRTVKISDEKKELYNYILEKLKDNWEEVEILNENKLISVKIGEKTYKIDIIETRQKK